MKRDEVLKVDLFFGTSGPRDGSALVAFVAESWGSDENHAKRPLVGSSGNLFNQMLLDTKNPLLAREKVFVTNCVSAQPPGNNMWEFFYPRAEAPASARFRGLDPRPDTRAEIERMYSQLRTLRPKVICVLGNWALWALTPNARISYETPALGIPGRLVPTGIGDFRGSMLVCDVPGLEGTYVLPLIHPAAIQRSWELRQTTINDIRVRVAQALADDWIDKQRLSVSVHYDARSAIAFLESLLAQLDSGPVMLACDIETTKKSLITCIGFCSRPCYADVIPFVRFEGKNFDSHFSIPDEVRITTLLCRVLTHPNARLVGQNFQYDQYFIWRSLGIVLDCYADTMLAQHIFLPGEPKDLGYLSSLYCRYHRYWKDDNKEWSAKGDLHTHFLYNGEDTIRTLEIISRQLPMLEARGMMKPTLPNGRSRFSFIMNQNRVCFSMSRFGILTDPKRHLDLTLEMGEAASHREALLYRLVPQELFTPPKTKKKDPTPWYNSNKLQKELYYDILGLPVQRHRKTKQPTLDKENLPKLIDRFPWIEPFTRPLLELRQIEVFSSNFLAAKRVNNRMHCTFNPGGTETLRLSSGKTPLDEGCNAQNQPKGNEKDD